MAYTNVVLIYSRTFDENRVTIRNNLPTDVGAPVS